MKTYWARLHRYDDTKCSAFTTHKIRCTFRDEFINFVIHPKRQWIMYSLRYVIAIWLNAHMTKLLFRGYFSNWKSIDTNKFAGQRREKFYVCSSFINIEMSNKYGTMHSCACSLPVHAVFHPLPQSACSLYEHYYYYYVHTLLSCVSWSACIMHLPVIRSPQGNANIYGIRLSSIISEWNVYTWSESARIRWSRCDHIKSAKEIKKKNKQTK